MFNSIKRTLRDMTIGAVITASAMGCWAAPHIQWSMAAGNQSVAVAQATQAVMLADMMPAPAHKPQGGKQ